MPKATKPDESEVTTAVEVDPNSRADEARQVMDAQIDLYVLIYKAIAAKVDGEHARAAIFTAVVNEK